jgi:hypothetical protein
VTGAAPSVDRRASRFTPTGLSQRTKSGSGEASALHGKQGVCARLLGLGASAARRAFATGLFGRLAGVLLSWESNTLDRWGACRRRECRNHAKGGVSDRTRPATTSHGKRPPHPDAWDPRRGSGSRGAHRVTRGPTLHSWTDSPAMCVGGSRSKSASTFQRPMIGPNCCAVGGRSSLRH